MPSLTLPYPFFYIIYMPRAGCIHDAYPFLSLPFFTFITLLPSSLLFFPFPPFLYLYLSLPYPFFYIIYMPRVGRIHDAYPFLSLPFFTFITLLPSSFLFFPFPPFLYLPPPFLYFHPSFYFLSLPFFTFISPYLTLFFILYTYAQSRPYT